MTLIRENMFDEMHSKSLFNKAMPKDISMSVKSLQKNSK
jgi:hypothetical protein